MSVGSHAVKLGDKLESHTGLRVDGQQVRLPSVEVHYVLHKPRGYVSTMSDPEGRPSVADLLPRLPGRLFPVGRLDFGSEGLLLVTSDGQLANALMHPSFGVEKEYAVKLRDPLDDKQLARLRRGVVEEGERLTLRSIASLPSRSQHAWYSVVLGEGKNHHIRRMMAVVPAQVLRLKRVRIGPLRIGDLAVGQIRPLLPEEVAMLRDSVRKTRQAPQRKPAAAKTSTRKPVAGQPATRKPATRKPAAGQPAAGQPANRKPAAGQPANRKPVARKPKAPLEP